MSRIRQRRAALHSPAATVARIIVSPQVSGAWAWLAALLAVAIAACSSVREDGVWMSPGFAGTRISHVLVIGVSDDLARRKRFEDAMVRTLEGAGARASSSYHYAPTHDYLAPAFIRPLIERLGVDVVLITRVTETSQETLESLARRSTPSTSLYAHLLNERTAPARRQRATAPETFDVVHIRSVLFDSRSAQPVWEADFKALGPQRPESVISDLADKVVTRLTRSGLLAAE